MSNLIKLIKIELLNIFSIEKFKKDIKDKAKLKEKIIILFIFLLLIPSFYSIILGLDEFYKILNNLDKTYLYFPIIFLGLLGFQIFIGFINLFSKYFYSKDLKQLISLPIEIGDIFLSKCFTALIREYILILPVLTGVFYIFGKYNGFYTYYIIICIITFLTIGILPHFINSIFLLFIGNITSFSKNKDRLRIIYSLIFILTFIFFQNKIIGGSFSLDKINTLLIEYEFKILNSNIYKLLPIYFLISSIYENNIINLILYLGYNLILIFILRTLGNNYYLSALEKKGSKKVKNKSSKLKVNKKSKIRAIFEKELIVIFRTPSYFINVILGVILIPIILYINIKILQEEMSGEVLIFNIYILSIILNLATNISSSSISREGKSNYLNYVLPISYKEQFLGRYLASMTLSLIQILLSILVLIVLRLENFNIFKFLIINFTIVSVATFTGLAIDKNNPKLDWKYPEEAMKRNLNVLKNLILNIILAILLLVLIKKTFINSNNFINILMGLLLNLITYKISIKVFED